MPWPLLAAAAAFAAVNLLVNALVLWLDCRALRVRLRLHVCHDPASPHQGGSRLLY